MPGDYDQLISQTETLCQQLEYQSCYVHKAYGIILTAGDNEITIKVLMSWSSDSFRDRLSAASMKQRVHLVLKLLQCVQSILNSQIQPLEFSEDQVVLNH